MALPANYEEKVYAGVLGKIIGVYLGRPFEGWRYDRIMAELGADMVKTFYTGESFATVTAGTPIPILALGAKKTKFEKDALRLAASAVRDGARGVVFGRNVVQAREPERFLDALKEVVKNQKDPDKVAAKFKLD